MGVSKPIKNWKREKKSFRSFSGAGVLNFQATGNPVGRKFNPAALKNHVKSIFCRFGANFVRKLVLRHFLTLGRQIFEPLKPLWARNSSPSPRKSRKIVFGRKTKFFVSNFLPFGPPFDKKSPGEPLKVFWIDQETVYFVPLAPKWTPASIAKKLKKKIWKTFLSFPTIHFPFIFSFL